jgi:two-component system nitrogen regulation response regulator GlnG
LPESLRETSPVADQATGAEAEFSFEAFILRRLEEGTTGLSAEAHQQLDRLLLRMTLRHTGGNQVQAARLLGISRQTLRAKIRDLGLFIPGSNASVADDQD